jgi:hypothetical protein
MAIDIMALGTWSRSDMLGAICVTSARAKSEWPLDDVVSSEAVVVKELVESGDINLRSVSHRAEPPSEEPSKKAFLLSSVDVKESFPVSLS